jgi:hypothetical protein
MLANLKERIVDWYLTRKTGKSKKQREWEAWYEQNVNFRATRIKDMFKNFEHIIEVNPDKFCKFDPFAWVPCDDAKQYFWPQRELGDNCVWRMERVIKYPSTGNEWEVNEFGGEDKIFVATNNDYDATMIALKYT